MPSTLTSSSEQALTEPLATDITVRGGWQRLHVLWGQVRGCVDAYRYLRLFVWTFALPMLAASAYIWLGASDRYVSESRIAVRQAEGGSAAGSSLGLLGLGGFRSMEDMHFLEQHIYSADMVLSLEAEIGLRDRWLKSPDWFSRLESDASLEAFLDYFKRRVSVSADTSTGIITVQTEAFEPNDARLINKAILVASDRFINELSNRVAREQVGFIKQELIASQARVETARKRVLDYQNEHQVLDPSKQAEMKARLAADLETRLSEVQAELNSSLSYLQQNAPPVMALKARSAALKKQIAKEKAELSGQGRLRLNQIAADYQSLTLDVEFAADLYQTALSALEKARVDATMKFKSLALIATPRLPQEPLQPRRIYLTITCLLGLLTLYGIVSLTRATIADHRE